MTFKTFYVHQHVGARKLNRHQTRGFTLRVDHDPDNERNVLVRGAWCAASDAFSRKEGRRIADDAEVKSINKRALPELAATMHNKIGGSHWNDGYYKDRDYFYLLKYVV